MHPHFCVSPHKEPQKNVPEAENGNEEEKVAQAAAERERQDGRWKFPADHHEDSEGEPTEDEGIQEGEKEAQGEGDEGEEWADEEIDGGEEETEEEDGRKPSSHDEDGPEEAGEEPDEGDIEEEPEDEAGGERHYWCGMVRGYE